MEWQDEGYLELADLDAGEYNSTQSGLWTRGLLIRRAIADGEMAYFTTWCPAGTPIETLVAVEGHRWATVPKVPRATARGMAAEGVEEGFEVAKTELGLDHNETRSWHGWHRHVSLVMLAFAMLATIRHRANRGREKNQPAKLRTHIQTPGALVRAGDPSHRHPSRATAH
jgi:SRSO17 transposase